MEEKFYLRNRGDGDYFLESRTNNSASVVGSLNPTHFAEHKLSLKNCESIAIGLDVELFSAHYGALKVKSGKSVDYGLGASEGFEEGFQKALEILVDKKYSEDDIEEAFAHGQLNQLHNQKYFSGSRAYIQSLQQTEWDVEIEMGNTPIWENADVQGHVVCKKCGEWNESQIIPYNCKCVSKPNLDGDGCLILKRKICGN